jgi:hypothetical protein
MPMCFTSLFTSCVYPSLPIDTKLLSRDNSSSFTRSLLAHQSQSNNLALSTNNSALLSSPLDSTETIIHLHRTVPSGDPRLPWTSLDHLDYPAAYTIFTIHLLESQDTMPPSTTSSISGSSSGKGKTILTIGKPPGPKPCWCGDDCQCCIIPCTVM